MTFAWTIRRCILSPCVGSVLTAGSKRILIVDDDVGIQQLLEMALEAEGYSVSVAGDGLEALDRVDEEVPDLVILDLMMPRMDGFGFARELVERGIRDRLPIMVVTAANGAEHRGRAINAEAYVDKPFNLSQFLERVADLAA